MADIGNGVSQQQMSVKYGPAMVHFQVGRPLRHLSESIFVPVNAEGIMGAGLAGEVRLAAGPDIEQELRRQAPLSVGAAYLTGPGALSAQDVQNLVHGVITRQPGTTPRRGDPDRALESGLELLEGTTSRSLTVPMLNRQVPERAEGANATGLATILAAHLRRGTRLREITLAGLDAAYLATARSALVDLGGFPE